MPDIAEPLYCFVGDALPLVGSKLEKEVGRRWTAALHRAEARMIYTSDSSSGHHVVNIAAAEVDLEMSFSTSQSSRDKRIFSHEASSLTQTVEAISWNLSHAAFHSRFHRPVVSSKILTAASYSFCLFFRSSCSLARIDRVSFHSSSWPQRSDAPCPSIRPHRERRPLTCAAYRLRWSPKASSPG
ncbi:hypothetical protein KC335_g63 [Hortaea werneckii]|nr:hypothetical protein KC335_g63 [Hortaea werneckii]